ncbi:hypothetical protein P4114_23495 [Pseudomonas aeruginosa]|nr:hypothetical protein [Pseudomonas aeruginosa]
MARFWNTRLLLASVSHQEPGAQQHLVALGAGIAGELADLRDQAVERTLVGVVVQGGGEMGGDCAVQG